MCQSGHWPIPPNFQPTHITSRCFSLHRMHSCSQGFKLKMDDMGNILIKRLSKSPVYARNTLEVEKKCAPFTLHCIQTLSFSFPNQESALSNDIIKLSGGLLELDKPFKLFDMKKFQQNVNRELKRQYPDRR